jgi:ppGpp synthetase/RelA/SpoT-type nucleotidyltranferase
MPLTPDMITDAFSRYRREYDCYQKLANYVARKCEREIIRANTLRATVTARAKAPDKFREKLDKKYKSAADLNSADDALRRVTDLAGVRISTYLEADRPKVVAEINKLFDGPNAGSVHIEMKDLDGHYYRATHCQVSVKKDDLDDDISNLEGLTCEIQVCSMLAHVWNEIEHDLAYKPTTGALSNREKDSLTLLAQSTMSGDIVIKQLFEANADRIRQAQDLEAPFLDVYDFVTRMRDSFPKSSRFGDYAGQLYENLTVLGIDTPIKIKDELLPNTHEQLSEQLCQQFHDYLASIADGAVHIEPDTSDAMLVLLLDKKVDEVLANNPMGRGKGRPPRIARVATRFKDMKDAQATAAAPPVLRSN